MNKPSDSNLKVSVPEGKLPSSNYWSEEHYQDELEYVFRRSWLNVCRESELPNPGDFVVKDLYALGVSALIVRGRDGVLR
ncbi:MAG: aromatic ring-hydroxylating dioxygenase subunit alpha, partial [Gammaproteobacteria bacterium]|nr:aromatic ring-hydroxylating dioxygenase subunit alpha [Gammaproteobacteria bacterium]